MLCVASNDMTVSVADTHTVQQVVQVVAHPKVRPVMFDIGPEPDSDEWKKLDPHARDACLWFRQPFQVVTAVRTHGGPSAPAAAAGAVVPGADLAGPYEGATTSSTTDDAAATLDAVAFECFRAIDDAAVVEYSRARKAMRAGLLRAEIAPQFVSTTSIESVLGGRVVSQKVAGVHNADPHARTYFLSCATESFTIGSEHGQSF